MQTGESESAGLQSQTSQLLVSSARSRTTSLVLNVGGMLKQPCPSFTSRHTSRHRQKREGPSLPMDAWNRHHRRSVDISPYTFVSNISGRANHPHYPLLCRLTTFSRHRTSDPDRNISAKSSSIAALKPLNDSSERGSASFDSSRRQPAHA